jgi:hypothetical protein
MDVNPMFLKPHSKALAKLAKDIEALSRNLEQNKHLWKHELYREKAHDLKYRCLDMLKNIGKQFEGVTITGAARFNDAGQAIRFLVSLVRDLEQVEAKISHERKYPLRR